jgi:hypothetical protein
MTWDKAVVDRTTELSSWVDFCYQIMKRGVLILREQAKTSDQPLSALAEALADVGTVDRGKRNLSYESHWISGVACLSRTAGGLSVRGLSSPTIGQARIPA